MFNDLKKTVTQTVSDKRRELDKNLDNPSKRWLLEYVSWSHCSISPFEAHFDTLVSLAYSGEQGVMVQICLN